MSDMNSTVVATSVDDVRAWLIGRASTYVRQPESAIDPTVPMMDLGLESVHAMALIGDVTQRYQIDLDPAAVWVYPTIDLLAELIDEERSLR